MKRRTRRLLRKIILEEMKNMTSSRSEKRQLNEMFAGLQPINTVSRQRREDNFSYNADAVRQLNPKNNEEPVFVRESLELISEDGDDTAELWIEDNSIKMEISNSQGTRKIDLSEEYTLKLVEQILNKFS